MSEKNIRIMGVDPGSRLAGVAFLEAQGSHLRHLENGVIRLKPKEELGRRLLSLSLQLQDLIEKYQPSVVVVEKVFLGKNVASAFTLGHARGVVLAEAARVGAEILECAPRAVKKGVTGHGGADKAHVQSFLSSIFQIRKFETEDASDALALALYGARIWQRERTFAQQGVSLR